MISRRVRVAHPAILGNKSGKLGFVEPLTTVYNPLYKLS
jgi:hypothetical protein